jgi:GcrA cell cycle regulator
MQTDWPAEHCQALREYLARGMSFSRAADAINAAFKTCYSRSAAIGRAKRMGLAGPDRLEEAPQPQPQPPPQAQAQAQAQAPRPHIVRERHAAEILTRMPIFEADEPIELRDVDVDPRHLSMLELAPDDCRYPYGGEEDGQAITFCAHPRRRGSSYCAAHFDLTRDPGAAPEPAADAVALSIVETA